ncbi:MAG: hypothetical protein AABZ85_02025, partial [Thermodesulfobacteriota bacterium]
NQQYIQRLQPGSEPVDVFGADILYAIPKVFLPQAVVMGLLSPLLFRLLHRFEVFPHAEDTRPARRI